MIYQWCYQEEKEIQVKLFLREQGISKRLLAKVKYEGGKIWINGEEQYATVSIKKGDKIEVLVPDEGEHETTIPSNLPIKILYEDAYFLVVDKPAGVASIPSRKHPHLSMANRVKGYYQQQNYPDQVIHIVTRLDRDTTGAMLFAKNRYAHAKMDRLLRQKEVEKIYWAILSNGEAVQKEHGFIEAPIGRTADSIMTRTVREDGKAALTEYWVLDRYPEGPLIRIKLHTGRTHQIRVHFTYMDAPLLGDDLYGGKLVPAMQRQALHCRELHFIHPFTQKKLSIESPLPGDFQEWLKGQKEEGDELNGRKTI